MSQFKQQMEAHRPALLRHCYRMLGSFSDAEDLVQDVLFKAWQAQDSYGGLAPLEHWLMRIATNRCLNELEGKRRRGLPHYDFAAAPAGAMMVPVEEGAVGRWLTAAPDDALFETPGCAVEARESVALAFIALLQRLPARQRAVLLLKDVLGWTTHEIAQALDISPSSAQNALHRARKVTAHHVEPSDEPPPDALAEYLRAWQERDVDALVRLMREDIVLSMPPFETWFRSRSAVEHFLRSDVFTKHWSAGFRLLPTRANGGLGVAFYRKSGEQFSPSSLQVVRFVANRLASMVIFISPDSHRGFGLPRTL